jgi:excisionase family DNA binding protein
MKLYTIREISEIFSVSETTIRNWIKDGIIKSFKVKGIVRIKEEELEKIIK